MDKGRFSRLFMISIRVKEGDFFTINQILIEYPPDKVSLYSPNSISAL